ncbi:MAG: substrate-binding domain-containing protein [Vulcanimicrobiaceae bacterium]
MSKQFIALVATICLLAGCSGARQMQANQPASNDPNTLSLIAGSELKDLEPYLDQIKQQTGVTLALTYSGTFAGIDRIEGGEPFDGAWFSQAKYLVMSDTAHRVKTQTKIMLSPVVLAVKQSTAHELGWDHNPNVTWKEIAKAAGDGRLHYAMTNPTTSNSGFSAAIGVASAMAGTADALAANQIDQHKLNDFFKGQTLTSGSSGWLIDSYVRDEARLDGLVNYEANLLELNRSGKLHEPLVLIYPKEGMLTADYPLILINDAKRAQYDKVVAYLKGAEFQKTIMTQTFRRPVNSDVALDAVFPKSLIVDLPCLNSRATVDAILYRYLNENRIPPHSYFVLDVSGSMEGERLASVQKALDVLAGDDPSIAGRFARFENREEMTMISFSSQTNAPVNFTMHRANDQATLSGVKNYAQSLRAGGNTAIFSAIETAIASADQSRHSDRAHYYSIVLMTDGENNEGDSFDTFRSKFEALPQSDRVRVFPIIFGEASPEQLQELADLTGGKLFDGRHEALSTIFKEIRGYQ